MRSEPYALTEDELDNVLRAALRTGPMTEDQLIGRWVDRAIVNYSLVLMAINEEIDLDFTVNPASPIVTLRSSKTPRRNLKNSEVGEIEN